MCDLAMVLQLQDIETQVLAERQVAAVLVAANRWPEDVELPSISAERQALAERLMTLPEPPRPPTPEQAEELELHQALGVGRGRR